MGRPRKARKGRRAKVPEELTEAEWAIMKTVWEHETCAAPTVQEALAVQTGWSYSTVKTIMDRMAKKGVLSTERVRNLVLYRAAVSPAQARKEEVLSTLQRAFGVALFQAKKITAVLPVNRHAAALRDVTVHRVARHRVAAARHRGHQVADALDLDVVAALQDDLVGGSLHLHSFLCQQ